MGERSRCALRSVGLAIGWRAACRDRRVAGAAETPKRGGTLTYMIPADAPPSFDGHRETTFATVHSAAPFYSVLIRINPENPSSTTDFVCDLCTEMPKPTDDGKTYTFKIRQGVKFHDGSPLTADDVAASWQEIVFPPRGRAQPARRRLFHDGRQGRGARPVDRRLPPEIRDHRVSAGARRPLRLDLREGDPRQGPALVRKEHPGLRPVQIRRLRDRPVDQGRAQPRLLSARACPISTASSASIADKQATRIDAIRADRAAIEFRGLPPSARDELVKALGDKIAVQESDWNCGSAGHPEPQEEAVRRCPGAPRPDPGDRPLARRAGAVEDRQCPHRRRHRLSRLAARRRPRRNCRDRRLLARHREIAGRGQAAVEGGRRRGAELRAAQPQCRPALQICRHLAGRRMEQDRAQGDAARRADRPLVRGDARRQFRGRRLRPIATASSTR